MFWRRTESSFYWVVDDNNLVSRKHVFRWLCEDAPVPPYHFGRQWMQWNYTESTRVPTLPKLTRCLLIPLEWSSPPPVENEQVNLKLDNDNGHRQNNSIQISFWAVVKRLSAQDVSIRSMKLEVWFIPRFVYVTDFFDSFLSSTMPLLAIITHS